MQEVIAQGRPSWPPAGARARRAGAHKGRSYKQKTPARLLPWVAGTSLYSFATRCSNSTCSSVRI
jgi:hypothetical protein